MFRRNRPWVGPKKEHRTIYRWTEQLVEYADLSVNYLATTEIGRKAPSLRTLARLAQALGVDISDLVAIEGEKKELDIADCISRSLDNLDKGQAEFTMALLRFVSGYLGDRKNRA